MTSLTKTEQNEILARWSKKLGGSQGTDPVRTGFGHVFPLCEFSVPGEVGGGGGIFLKGSRKLFNCLLFALKGLHVFFSVAILAHVFQTSGKIRRMVGWLDGWMVGWRLGIQTQQRNMFSHTNFIFEYFSRCVIYDIHI